MTTLAPPRTGAPPPAPKTQWVKRNLFRTPLDGVLTVVFGSLALYASFRFVRFIFVNARWEIIDENLKLMMVGRWPVDELIRVAVSLVVLSAWGGLIAGVIAGRQIRRGTSAIEGMSPAERTVDLIQRFGLVIASLLLLLALTETRGPWITVAAMVAAGVAASLVGRRVGVRVLPKWGSRAGLLVLAGVPVVLFFYLTAALPLARWEGFMYNLTAAAAGIILSFPLGVLLALGRRSKLWLLQKLAVLYIEFVRAAPLYVLLLMASVSLEFFVPASLAPSKVIRSIVVFTLFTAAYLAEIVRGGLQSVPRGQEEAAKSVGLSPVKQTFLIILPQALRNVIPAQIGQFIILFKDTTLAGLALGILEILNVAQAITQQEAFRGQGLIVETLVFVGFLFWVGSFTMSRESQRLERKLGVGTR